MSFKLFKARVFYMLKLITNFVENKIFRLRLKNDNFTILSSTCAGGIIYHKLGKRFLSPTVNLWISEKDLQKLARNLKHYMEQELEFVESEYSYPVALCDDIRIGFNHAKDEKEAAEIWYRRCKRVNYDNIFIISSDNKLDYADIKAFADLPCKGKVMFTAKDYSEFDFVLPFTEYEKQGLESVGVYMSNHTPVLDRFVFQKYFDYVYWLNTGKIRRKRR